MNVSVKVLELIWERALEVAPHVALVLVVIIVGVILSWMLRRFARWMVRASGIETLAEKAGVAKLLYTVGFKDGLAELVARLAWIGGLLLTLSAVADLLQLEAVAAVTALAIRFLPRLLAASGVLLAGVALASVVRNVVESMGRRRDELDQPDFVAKLAYYVIVTVSVTLAADQAGLETAIVDALILVVVAIGLGALGLSFALGARPVFGKLAARHYYENLAQPGDRVKVDEHEGVVLRYSAVAMVIDLGDGREAIIPCDQLLDRVVLVDPMAPPPRPSEQGPSE